MLLKCWGNWNSVVNFWKEKGVVIGTEYVPTATGKSDHIEIDRGDLVEVKLKPWVKTWVSPPLPKKKAIKNKVANLWFPLI